MGEQVACMLVACFPGNKITRWKWLSVLMISSKKAIRKSIMHSVRVDFTNLLRISRKKNVLRIMKKLA